jgi:hypothetical protein
LLRDPDRGTQDCSGVYIPCQTHEHGSCTTIIIVGLLQLSDDVLADCLIIVGGHSRPRALSGVDILFGKVDREQQEDEIVSSDDSQDKEMTKRI